MKNKIICVILAIIFMLPCLVFISACDAPTNGDPNCIHVWDEGQITKQPSKTADGITTYVCTLCQGTKNEALKLKVPTTAETYTAIQKVADEDIEGYDFNFSLGANLSILGLGQSVEGNYIGKYRNNKTTSNEIFYRQSTGALFFDSSAYSYTSNNKKIRIDCNNNIPEKISVLPNDSDNFFINKTIVSIVHSIQESHINNVNIDNMSTPYNFVSTINLNANNSLLSKFTSILGKFGTKIAFKGVSIVNPAAIPFHFNIDENGRLNDYALELNLEISIKLTKVTVFLKYSQNSSNSTIEIPNIDNLSIDSSKINNDIATINQAINAVKNYNTYSIDTIAKNEFDPAWNKLALVDEYKSRLYKNKVDNNIWFNHSYEYHSHHESDGAEKYAYTIGNITDGSTYIVSRKGSNITTPIANVSADTQFDYLVKPFILNANNIDCISSTTSNTTTVYKIHLNNTAAVSIQDKILDIINSNDEPGVIDVNNYMNEQISIKNATFIVTITNNQLESISIKTDFKYNPTGGDYTDYNVTLSNVLELKINKELQKAQAYIAPERAEGNVFQPNSLNHANLYIL